MLASQARGRGFKSRPVHYLRTTKDYTPILNSAATIILLVNIKIHFVPHLDIHILILPHRELNCGRFRLSPSSSPKARYICHYFRHILHKIFNRIERPHAWPKLTLHLPFFRPILLLISERNINIVGPFLGRLDLCNDVFFPHSETPSLSNYYLSTYRISSADCPYQENLTTNPSQNSIT